MVVGVQHRPRQKRRHLAQERFRHFLVAQTHGVQRHLGRRGPLRMPAHAIGQHKQTGLAGVAVSEAILVQGARPLLAVLVHREFHRLGPPATVDARGATASDTILSNCMRMRSVTDSLV